MHQPKSPNFADSMVRCQGLTNDRRRCADLAIEGMRYCELHKLHNSQILQHSEDFAPRGFVVVSGILRSIARRRHPDPVSFDVPNWLKRCSTELVIAHLLRHPDASVRWCAAFVLRKRREPIAIEPLWEAMHSEHSSIVRQQAAVALGKIGSRFVMAPLIEGLVHDRDAGVRQACAIALGNLGYRDAAGELVLALHAEEAAFVRWDCVLSLGRLGGKEFASFLTGCANNDRAEAVRRACVQVLEEMRTESQQSQIAQTRL